MTIRIVKDGDGKIVDRDSLAHRYWLERGYVEEKAEHAPAPAKPWAAGGVAAGLSYNGDGIEVVLLHDPAKSATSADVPAKGKPAGRARD